MIYALILGPIAALLIGLTGGYFLGRYQTTLLDKIRTLQEDKNNQPLPPPEPEKPQVAGGAYQPPKEVSPSTDKKIGAGLVETKTPELLDWENKNEIDNLV
jgi:hypothetical protein